MGGAAMQHASSNGFLQPRNTPSGRGHAVVIGASMAGLLAARVLADHFERVTIVERDQLPDAPGFRAGVPQSRHLHVLLGRGRAVLEQLFPGLVAELLAAGAQSFEWPGDILWLSPGGWGQRFRPGLPMLSASRELLEWHVRRRVAALGPVQILPRDEVEDLVMSSDHAHVTGVRVRSRAADTAPSAGSELLADLVVDASGRTSRMPRWLAAHGYPAPEETVVNSYLGYASRLYAAPADGARDWTALFFQAQPPAKARGGGLFPIEDGRWIVTLAGAGRDYPPTDDAGFLAFARSLRSPILYEAIVAAQPLSPIAGYQRTENQLRHYERLDRRPECLLVLGDAVCAFNPIYGQGMTVAALAALNLDRCLKAQRRRKPDGDLAGLAARFQRRLARANVTPWLLATGEDLRFPTTVGGQTGRAMRLVHGYLDKVIAASADDRHVSRVFTRVLHMLVPPVALLRPSVILASLRHSGNDRLQAAPTNAAYSMREAAS